MKHQLVSLRIFFFFLGMCGKQPRSVDRRPSFEGVPKSPLPKKSGGVCKSKGSKVVECTSLPVEQATEKQSKPTRPRRTRASVNVKIQAEDIQDDPDDPDFVIGNSHTTSHPSVLLF